MNTLVTIAVPGGRMLAEALAALSAAGYPCDMDDGTRKLMFESGRARFIVARPGDVPVYVTHGAADLGIVGKDVLIEDRPDVYELLDLRFGAGRFVVAAPADRAREAEATLASPEVSGRVRVATKFPRVTEAFFTERGIRAQVIALRGATELAPQAGLADMVVDIVSTGRTLSDNNLVVVAEVGRTTARLIANRASFGLRSPVIKDLVEALRRGIAS
ncbi:MAG: ATP phosphoribosyltransferase [Firmicutes bacterium]|jgi:ATP phosphoribosyltransferase|nr:ATP phosphoribosyltransferase [Bacillota bacterium]